MILPIHAPGRQGISIRTHNQNVAPQNALLSSITETTSENMTAKYNISCSQKTLRHKCIIIKI